MNSEARVPEKQILEAEFQMMLSKENEMKELYDEILKRVENQHVRNKIEAIRNDEIKHMGYVEIILSLLEIE
jgi:rubrerythrin